MRSMMMMAALAATATADPKPPSTGKEMPTAKLPGPAEAKATVMAAVQLASAGSPTCTQVVNPKMRLAFQLSNPGRADLLDHVDAWVRIARCAEQLRYYKLELEIGEPMAKLAGKHAELAALGAIGLGRFDLAKSYLVEGLKRAPGDGNLLVTAAKATCMKADWKDCLLYAGEALKAADAMTDRGEKLAIASRALKYAARAAVHTGQLDKAEVFRGVSEKLGGDKADLAEIRDMLLQAKLDGVLVEPRAETELALGVYHLYGKIKDAGPLLRLRITNLSGADAAYSVEVAVDGVTQTAAQRVAIANRTDKELVFDPPLRDDFKIDAVRAVRAAQLSIKVTATAGKIVYQQTRPLDLQPRDFLPTMAADSADAAHSTRWFYGAWITPNAKAVDAFLQKAKLRAEHNTFSGEQSDTLQQVKAIYDELRAEGMSYVMDPEVLANDAVGQRTRLPSEVLASTNAQCLEGTLLYATLFEAIGLKPIIVRVPGHAFVGWRPSPKDKLKSKLPSGIYFLETTLTHDATFEQAVNRGLGEFEDHHKQHDETTFDIAALRKLGVTPQPID
jgi:hypothetical protein